jgi:type I restriction enzyme S subunit
MGLVEDFIRKKWYDREDICNPMLKAWKNFDVLGVADSTFETAFSSGDNEKLYQRLWEMNLGLHLSSLGGSLSSKDKGPDFNLQIDGKTIWVEAVCPTPSGISEKYISPLKDDEIRVVKCPSDEILLRWTQGLSDKKKQFDNYMDSTDGKIPIVGNNDLNVIAINGCQLGFHSHDCSPSLQHSIVVVTVPIGGMKIIIDRKTLKQTGNEWSYRDKIIKNNGSSVPTDTFLNPDYSYISAAIGSVFTFDNNGDLRDRMVLVHNPNAVNPLPEKILKVDKEYVIEDDGETISLKNILI